jgi:hypothetical protein
MKFTPAPHQQAARTGDREIYALALTLILALLGGCDRTAPPPASTLSTGAAQSRSSAPAEPPCPGWGNSLAARDLSGRCRAYPKPTPGALEAIPDAPALKKKPKAQAPPAQPKKDK